MIPWSLTPTPASNALMATPERLASHGEPWEQVTRRRVVSPALPLGPSPGAPPSASSGLFDAHMFELANGMRVVLVPDHRAPGDRRRAAPAGR
jgi:hypothetical protein